MTVVADSTPCIYLARLGDLGMFQKLFGRIVLPEAVVGNSPLKAICPARANFKQGWTAG